MTTQTPDWFEEAVALKAQGKSVRAIAETLEASGYGTVSHGTVWLWTTRKGMEQRESMQSPEHKARAREIARRHYQKQRSDR